MNLTEGTYIFTCIHIYTWASQVAQYYRIDLPLQEIQEMGGSILVSGRYPGGGNGKLVQYSCLENLMERGAWQAAVHGAAKSQT